MSKPKRITFSNNRSRKLIELCKGENVLSKDESKLTEKRKSLECDGAPKPKKKTKLYPSYVDLFDRGDWEELDSVLRTPIDPSLFPKRPKDPVSNITSVSSPRSESDTLFRENIVTELCNSHNNESRLPSISDEKSIAPTNLLTEFDNRPNLLLTSTENLPKNADILEEHPVNVQNMKLSSELNLMDNNLVLTFAITESGELQPVDYFPIQSTPTSHGGNKTKLKRKLFEDDENMPEITNNFPVGVEKQDEGESVNSLDTAHKSDLEHNHGYTKRCKRQRQDINYNEDINDDLLSRSTETNEDFFSRGTETNEDLLSRSTETNEDLLSRSTIQEFNIIKTSDLGAEYEHGNLDDPDYELGVDSDDSTLDVHTKLSENSHENDNLEILPSQGPSSSLLKISRASLKKVSGKRYWDKKHACFYCEKIVTNFKRHLTRNHSCEIDVAKMLASSDSERKKLLSDIRKKGDFFHNTQALREQKGELLVARRPTLEESNSVDKYLPCSKCLAFFKRDKLYLHVKNCRKEEIKTKYESHQGQGSTLLMMSKSSEYKELKDKIFSIMRVDKISNLIKNDSIICEYGNRLLKKNCENHLRQVISGKMRELGRLLDLLQTKTNSNHPLQEFISPEFYPIVVDCVKELAGFDNVKGIFLKPSLATKLGHSLRQCADIIECKAMIVSNTTWKEKASHFKLISEKQWLYDISSRALKSLDTAKWNKTNLIPLAKDIQLLHKLISEKELKYQEYLNSEPNDLVWRHLAKITLAHLIVLNRRRAGEVQRILIEDFKKVHKGVEDSEIASSFNKCEQLLTQNLYRLEIRGKRGKKVPILLTPVIKTSLDILVRTRMICNVNNVNPYLFALPYSVDSCFRGTDILRSLAKECGASMPETLTSTKLRKHVATVSQLLNLQKNELEQVAQFMGHNLNIHFDFYRLPEREVQIAKLGKLFLALEQGKIAQYHGKKLDDITVYVDGDEIASDSELEEVDEDMATVTSQSQENNQKKLTKEVNNQTSYTTKRKVHKKTPVNDANHDEESDDDNDDPNWQNDEEEESNNKRTFKLRKCSQKKPWSDEEVDAVKKHLLKKILSGTLPGKSECEKCIKEEPILKNRPWTKIKDYCRNQIKKLKRA